MCVVGHVPDVRHAFLLEVGVDVLTDVDEAVLVAAGKPEQLQLLGRFRSGRSSAGGLVFGAEEKPPTQANVSR